MSTSRQHSTLEAIQKQNNQPGLETDLRSSPPKYEDNYIGEAVAKEDKKRILGFRRNIFITIVVFVVLLLLGIIGGAIGGIKSKKTPPSILQSPPPPSSSPSPLPTTNILQNTSLAAVNWTSGDKQYYGVFFQDKNNSIFMSLWDPIHLTWTPSPIAIDVVHRPLPGTHIVATAWTTTNPPNNIQVNIYITSKDNELLEFYTEDPYAGRWFLGVLTSKSPPVIPMHGSQHAVHNLRCPSDNSNSPITPVLLYQTNMQTLKYAMNCHDWIDNDFLETTFEPGAVMALISTAPGGNNLNLNGNSNDLKAYIGSTGRIAEYTWNGSRWADENGFYKNKTPPKAPLAISATSLKATTTYPWPDLLVLGIYLEGDTRILRIMLLTGQEWIDPQAPEMTKSIGNITAMATNFDRRFYGISEGQIYEYEILGNTLKWDFKGIVKT